MKAQDGARNQLTFEIPIGDLERYRSALLSVLSRISIHSCDTQFKDDLKTVYALISRMGVDNLNVIDQNHVITPGEERDGLFMIG